MLKARLLAWRLKRYLFPPTKTDGKLCLHLGCGQDYRPGYVNVDVSQMADCDLRLDFSQIGEVYLDGSVTEVLMIHSLSYLRLWQARKLLADVYRLLEQGGRLIIELPDLTKCARKVLESEGDLVAYLEAVRGLYAFSLEMIEQREQFIPYAFGWSGWHLKLELERTGFSQVQICDPQTHGQRLWRDTRIEAVK